MNSRPLHSLLVCSLLVTLLSAGCAGRGQPPVYRFDSVPANTMLPMHPTAPRGLVMLDGRTGRALAWSDVIRAVEWADVTMLGERHDDAVAHAVQLAIVEDALAGTGAHGAVALEMLERNEQGYVDDYLVGRIDQATFIELTNSADWAGPGSWVKWYQPIIDAAAARGAKVIAANSPREYVRAARGGYASILLRPRSETDLFSIPRSRHEGTRYRERFFDLMSGGMGGGHGGGMTAEQLEGIFRSQLLWDATMADSIARAMERGAKRVILLAGGFHIEAEGGTVLELRARRPKTRILTITMIRAEARSLRQEDQNLADIVIYTGEGGE